MLSTVTLNILASCQNSSSCLDLSSPGLFNFGSFGVSSDFVPNFCHFSLMKNNLLSTALLITPYCRVVAKENTVKPVLRGHPREGQKVAA